MRPPDRKFIDPRDGKRPDEEGEPTAPRSHEKPGVLVVDDEPLVRILLQRGLERDGFEVWLAANGREAIEVYREHRDQIDVVLLDVRMPGLDGPQTLDALRELDPEVRACFMSGNPGAYDPEELLRRGAEVIAKPFHFDELTTLLRLLAYGATKFCPSGRDDGPNQESRMPRRYSCPQSLW
jgi:CheY-like chemotaxis protein